MFPVGIGNENLPEVIARDEAYNLLHTTAVELVEDVVEEQQRRTPTCRTAQKVELRKFQGQHIRLVLPLASLTFHGIPAELHHQVVLVRSVERKAHDAVFDTVALYDVQQTAALAVRDILE